MTQHRTILYVEDDADDREFLLEALKEADPEIEVVFAENGLEAMDYLETCKDTVHELPGLIVLDMNLPFIDGKEIFSRIKKNTLLQEVPVIVFSSSDKPSDKALFNKLGIEYFTKPDTVSYFAIIARHLLSVCG